MAKCVCPPEKGGKSGGKPKPKSNKNGGSTKIKNPGGTSKASNGGSKPSGGGKRKGHPANCFILYYLYMWRKYGGNYFCAAKECGRRWRSMPESEKQKYRDIYCRNLKGGPSRVCKRK